MAWLILAFSHENSGIETLIELAIGWYLLVNLCSGLGLQKEMGPMNGFKDDNSEKFLKNQLSDELIEAPSQKL